MSEISISDIAQLPSRFGHFKIQAFKEGDKEHLVIFKEPLSDVNSGVKIGSMKSC